MTEISAESEGRPGIPVEANAMRTRGLSALQLLASCPPWMWVTMIVAVSFVRLTTYAWQLPGPWIIPDELIYAELGRSVAESAAFTVRDEPTQIYAIVYSLVISPAYAVWDDPETSYRAAKAINSLVMSLAAIPVYLLARRFAERGWSIAAAALAVAVPSMAYTGVLMTENVFYPLFLLAALAMVAALERPTRSRQLLLLAAVGMATLARPQALAIVPAFLSAIVLLRFAEPRAPGGNGAPDAPAVTFRSYKLLWSAFAGLASVALALSAVRGASPLDLFGAYRHAFGTVDVTEVLWTVLYQFAVLDLYLGILPFAAALATTVVVLRRRLPRSLLPIWAVTISLTVWTMILVAVVTGRVRQGSPENPGVPDSIHERWFFYLAPLFFLLMLGFVQHRGKSGRTVVVSAAIAGLLPLALPIERFASNAQFESLALVPWLDTDLAGGPAPVLFAASLAVLFVVCCRRNAMALTVAIVACVLYGTGFAAQNGMLDASEWAAGRGDASHPSWIDRAVGAGQDVTVVLGPAAPASTPRSRFELGLPIWRAEFFNQSLGHVYHLGKRLPYNLPDEAVTIDAASRSLLDASGRRIIARWALADKNVRLAGNLVAESKSGLKLYRVGGKALQVG